MSARSNALSISSSGSKGLLVGDGGQRLRAGEGDAGVGDNGADQREARPALRPGAEGAEQRPGVTGRSGAPRASASAAAMIRALVSTLHEQMIMPETCHPAPIGAMRHAAGDYPAAATARFAMTLTRLAR